MIVAMAIKQLQKKPKKPFGFIWYNFNNFNLQYMTSTSFFVYFRSMDFPTNFGVGDVKMMNCIWEWKKLNYQ